MRVILKNANRIADVRYFNPANGTFWECSDHAEKVAHGLFCEQDGSLICMFASRGKLYLYLDGIQTTVNGEMVTIMDLEGQERRFRAYCGQSLLYDKTYPRKPLTDGNPFWPSDEEDEDILLWVHNIVNSPERQQIFMAPRKA